MANRSIWNIIEPRLELKIKDKLDARKIRHLMRPYMLSDDAIYKIKEHFQNEMTEGLEQSPGDFERLPMRITFVDHFKKSNLEMGNFISICANVHSFTITLVQLKPGASPEIHRKDYSVAASVFNKPYIKIYEAFANFVKDFFREFHLDGVVIPASFCTNWYMEQYSLNTAVIPNFNPNSKMFRSQRDIKASFERVLQKDDFQVETNLIKTSLSDKVGSEPGSCDTDRIYHVLYDAILLRYESVQGLEVTLDVCHNLLIKFQILSFEIEEPVQKILLDISHAGVQIQDKVFKNTLYHHPIHKMSHIVQDYANSHIFGYVCGDFLKGHQFFGFKTDKHSTEIVSLIRNIMTIELVRKQKEKLEVQASQVFITLKNFLNLVHELKAKEKEIPQLLKQRLHLVEDINWWLSGSSETVSANVEEPKEMILNVRLHELYAAAHRLKQIELEKELAAKIELEKLSKKRQHQKKKPLDSEDLTTDAQEKEPQDPILSKVFEVIAENINILNTSLNSRKEELVTIKEKLETYDSEFVSNVESSGLENLNHIREYCFSIYNLRNQEINSLKEQITQMLSVEAAERNKIQYKIPDIYTGKKQYLLITMKPNKGSIFEDIHFDAPKRIGKAKSELLDKVLICEDYFMNSLKMRREEVEELNYYISELHFRESIAQPEDSKAVEYCRRLLVKAAKMRLREIQDIEWKLKELKNIKEKILFLIPDTVYFVVDNLETALKKRISVAKKWEDLLSGFHVDLKLLDINIKFCYDIFFELKKLTENDVIDIEKEITEVVDKQSSLKTVTDICFALYNQTLKMRKKEFNLAVSDMDLFETVDADCSYSNEIDFIHCCQEIYLTCAAMREKEIETLENEVKSADQKLKIQDSDIVVSLQDLFHAAIELEKGECEKMMKLPYGSQSSDEMELFPVMYNFKDLYEMVTQYLKRDTMKSDMQSLFENPQIYTSLEDFLLASFELKQKEVEIPLPILKKGLESVLIELIEDVKKRELKKQLQRQIRDQALKVSRSWKEVFLLAFDIRNKEMENIILTKRKEIKEEEAVILHLKNDSQNMENEASQIVKSWEKIFSYVVDMKNMEVDKVNQLLKKSEIVDEDQKNNFLPKPGVQTIAAGDQDDEGYLEMEGSDSPDKEHKPSEEIMKAIESCKDIYNIAVSKGSSDLEKMKNEIRPIFSVEYDKEKVDLSGDEVSKAISGSISILSDLIGKIRKEVGSLDTNMDTLVNVEQNIKSQAASAKPTSAHLLTLLAELEETASKDIEEKFNELQKAFGNLESQSAQKFRPFVDLFVGVMSDEELETVTDVTKEQDATKEEIEPESQEPDVTMHKFTQEEIQALLLEVESELKTDEDEKGEKERNEVMDIFDTCKKNLKHSTEMRKISLDSIHKELDQLQLPDPKKMKPKEKNVKALKCIVACKGRYSYSLKFREDDIKILQLIIERMKSTQNKEQSVVVEFESSEIASSCRRLFNLAVEARKKNICLIKSELERLEKVASNILDDIKPEDGSVMKYEVYTACKDLVLESVDIKMKEIGDIASELETLSNIELKVGMQLKQLDPEKQKDICMKLEKAKDAVVTCKKVCSSATERAKKEVKDTDKELGLLKGALESSETSLVSATCKQLLSTNIEKQKSEILELQHEVQQLMVKVEELVKQLMDVIWTDDSTSLEAISIPVDDDASAGKEVPPSIEDNPPDIANNPSAEDKPPIIDDMNHREDHSDLQLDSNAKREPESPNFSVSGGMSAIEKACKIKMNMVADFAQECKENLQTNILKKEEEIKMLESDLDKIKVTLQKVEAEDSQVYSVCQNIFLSLVEMRREEIKCLELELKVLQKLLAETKPQTAQSSQKSDATQEDSEVSLAVASCKRCLNLARKNRNNEKDTIEFELMKLVRFQDSRIASMCKKLLLIAVCKSSEEMGRIERKYLKMDAIPSENEFQVLNESQKIFEGLCVDAKEQIVVVISALQLLSKMKMQMEIEESQFVHACRKHFSSQVCVREKEITVMRQELDTLSEIQGFEEGFDVMVRNIESVYTNICSEAISCREKGIDSFQFELIKHYDIKISEVMSTTQKYFLAYIDEMKKEFEQDGTVKIADAGKDKLWTEICKLQKFYAAVLRKRNEDCTLIEEVLMILQGKSFKSEKELKFDVKAPLKEEGSFEKLKTEACVVINGCKDILYSIVEAAEGEIRLVNVMKEEIKRHEETEVVRQKQTFSLKDENSCFTEKQIALFEAIERDNLNSESTKNQKVTDFCEYFLNKMIHQCEELIRSVKLYLEKLSNIEDGLLFEASKLAYYLMDIVKSIFLEQVKEKHNIQEVLKTLENVKHKIKDENNEIVENCQKMLSAISAHKKDLIGVIMVSVESLKIKEGELKVEISGAYRKCGDLLLKITEIIDMDVKYMNEELESLKVFGVYEDEDESALSEDEKAIKKCRLFLLAALDKRKKLLHTVHLELKFLKVGNQQIRMEDSKVFPSWCERFLAFLDLEKKNIAIQKTDFASSVLHDVPAKMEVASSFDPNESNEGVTSILKIESFKDLIKSLEQKRKKQPIYTISSWDDLLLRSFLIDWIEVEQLKRNYSTTAKQSSDPSDELKIEKNWEDLLLEADTLMQKQFQLTSKLKEKKQLFFPVALWSEVLSDAIDEWNIIVKEKELQMKNENLLLQWKGKIRSKKNLEYASGCKYGLQSSKLEKYYKSHQIEMDENLKMSPYSLDDPICESAADIASYSQDVGKGDDSDHNELNEKSSLWNHMFSESVKLMGKGQQAFNLMKKKDTKLQSEVIKVLSSWDELFLKAIDKRRTDIQEQRKENDILKDLAKSVNEETQGQVPGKAVTSQSKSHQDSWIQPILESSQLHKLQLCEALGVKKSEMEKSSSSETKTTELESEAHSFLSLSPEKILLKGKKLLIKALAIRKDEIREMEKELKSLQNLDENSQNIFKEIPQSIFIWKLIVSTAVSFKTSGQKFEPQSEMHFNEIPKKLLSAAMKSKMKETKCHDTYWKKFAEKQFFLNVIPNKLSWSKTLQTVSELAKKDLSKMSMFGIKAESDERETDTEIPAGEAIQKNLEALEDSACWTDLVLEAFQQTNYVKTSESLENESYAQEPLVSWDEIFFFMNQMSKEAIQDKIFNKDRATDDIKVQEIRHMVSTHFFSWDVLLTGVIEEILLALHNMSKDKDDIKNIHIESSDTPASVLNNSSINFTGDYGSLVQNTALKEILKKLGITSFIKMLPSEMGLHKLKMEGGIGTGNGDALNETKKKMHHPYLDPQRKELNKDTIQKLIFPIAVEVWRKKMKNYLNFQDCTLKKCEENSESNDPKSEHVGEKIPFELQSYDADLESLKYLEKKIAYDYIADVEENMNENLFEFKLEDQSKSDIKSSEFSPILLDDMKNKFKSGENMIPEFFSVSTAWYEVYTAALERHKNVLHDMMDLKEIQEDCLEVYPNQLTAKSDKPEENKLKFQAANVLHQGITLQDLFEIVDSLKRKDLVIAREIERKDELVEDVSGVSLENLKVSDVIDSFKDILMKAFVTRKREKHLLEQEIVKLIFVSSATCGKYRTFPVTDFLLQYVYKALKSRNEENDLIESKLRSLNEARNIFSGYIDCCPGKESLPKKNVRRIKELNNLLVKIEILRDSLKEKIKLYFDSLISTLEVNIYRRNEDILMIPFQEANECGGNLDFEDQEMFTQSKKELSILKLMKEKEIKQMENYLFEWKRTLRVDESLENTVHDIFSTILKHYDDDVFEKKKVMDRMLYETEYLENKKANWKSEVSLVCTKCKNFLLTAIESRTAEIALIKSADSIRKELKNPNARTLQVLSFCENYSKDFILKREVDIRFLEELIQEMVESEISKIQSACLSYFLKAIEDRNSELKSIEGYSESLTFFQDSEDSEFSKASEAIKEACADDFDFSEGKVFLKAISETKKSEKEKVDPEVLRKCSQFFAERSEGIQTEIKAMEANAELLKLSKGDVALEVIGVLEDFEKLMNKGLHAMNLDSENILSELQFMKNYQKSFYSEVAALLISCRTHFENNVDEVKHDMQVLQLQLRILGKDDITDDVDLDFDVFGDLDSALEKIEEIDTSFQGVKADSAVYSEESILFESCFEILNSASEFRLDYIRMFISEIKLLDGAENRAFQMLSSCRDHILNMCEKRKFEKERIEAILLPAEITSNADVISACMECISGLLQFNDDCLAALKLDLDRLKCTVLNMEQKRAAVFSLCEKNIQSSINAGTQEIEYMNSELKVMMMLSSEDSEYVSSSKDIFQKGIEERENEVMVLGNDLEALKSEIEILPIVTQCRQHLMNSNTCRKQEISSARKQIEILENEAAMISLVWAPSLDTIVEGNKKVIERLKPTVHKLTKIRRELECQNKKFLGACQKLYCSMLETLKIEREAVKHDIDSLREVELEKKEAIDTEGKELIVSFKDLFLAAFNLKKSDLEKDIRRRNIEENIKMKRMEIIQNLKPESIQKDPISKTTDDLDSLTDKEEESSSEKEENEETFGMFVLYYDTKKEQRKSAIEKKIMDEFETIENMLQVKSGDKEGLELSKYSEEEDSVEDLESQTKTEPFFNRVYEVKVKEIEENIKHKQEKINGVIESRRVLMEKIVMEKKKEMKENIVLKEKEMQTVIDSIRGQESNVICSLKDLFIDILHLKVYNCDSPLLNIIDDKVIPARFQTCHVSVKLDNFVEIALAIKKAELQMLQSKYKDIDKAESIMRKEVKRVVMDSNKKLEEAITQFRRSEKSKAMEYALSGGSTQKDSYVIEEDKIFPVIEVFKKYVESFKGFFTSSPKSVSVYEDNTFRSEEILKNNPTHIPLFRKQLPSIHSVSNHVLKLLGVEIKDLKKIISDMNLDKARAILHGLSFMSAETAVHDISTKIALKGILLNIVAALNENTSLLVLGNYLNENCEICLNLDKDCSLVYFEKIENVRKWCSPLESVQEVAIDIGLKYFGINCLDDISTKFDWAVNAIPVSSSRFERFIGDAGLLEQIKQAFLELHHQHLLCRKGNLNDSFKNFRLSFYDLCKLIRSKNVSECIDNASLPVICETPSQDDVAVAKYVSRIILMRGALLTAICLASVLERLDKERITIIATSLFIQDCVEYQRILKKFLFALLPEKKVDFLSCMKRSCGIGASIMASIAEHYNREMPELHLLELQERLRKRNTLFSIKDFLNLLSNPDLAIQAVDLAQRYVEEMKFDLPLAVVWAHHFINEKIDEAEALYKRHPISLSKVNHLLCQKIATDKNLELGRTYIEFLKRIDAEKNVKESAFKTLFDILFYKDMYQEAVALIEECLQNEISLTKLRHSTLTVLHDFCVRQASRKGEAPSFALPVKDFDSSSSDSDTEENSIKTARNNPFAMLS